MTASISASWMKTDLKSLLQLASLLILPASTPDNQRRTLVTDWKIGDATFRKKAVLYICVTRFLFKNTIAFIQTNTDTIFMKFKTYNFKIIQHLTWKHQLD